MPNVRPSAPRACDPSRSNASPEAFGAGRFPVVAELGEGGLGRVYHVRDTDSGQDVALKALHALRPDQIFHIKQEFRSFADINHPHVVALHELFVNDDEVFFTMELLDGVPITDYIRRTLVNATHTWSAIDVDRLDEALRQLMLGVAVLHSAKRLHRDLKPSNVLVTRDARVVVLDFDMGLRIGIDDREEPEPGLAGTPEYMSPEQVWGFDVSAASDWYGVGVILYESITGELPHQGALDELVAQKKAGVSNPQQLAQHVPTELTNLVTALLAPAIADRAGESAVRQYLRQRGFREARLWDTAGNEFTVPFVGREHELGILEKDFERVQEGQTVVATIEGAPGVGKSELIRHFLSKISQNLREAPIVLRGRCHPRETVPYRAFDGVVDALSAALVPISKTFDTIEHAAALVRLFPVLGRVDAFSVQDDEVPKGEPFEMRKGAVTALRFVFSQLASRNTVVLWLDDLQWGDADSGQLLRELLRPPYAPPILCILTYREGTRRTSSFWRSYDESIAAPIATTHFLLGPLATSATMQLAEALARPRGPDSSAWAGTLLTESGGNPLLLGELAHELANTTATAPPHRVLERIWHERLDSLSAADRRIVEMVVIAGRPLELALLLKAAEVGEHGRNALGRLSKLRLLCNSEVNTRPAIDAYHARLRDVLLTEMPTEVLQARHLSLAETIRQSPAPEPGTLVEHYLAAGHEPMAAMFVVDAADRAASALAFERAAELYTLAIRLGAKNRPRWQLERDLAEAFANDGRSRQAADAYQNAAGSARHADAPAHVRLDLQLLAAEHYLRSGYVQEGGRVLENVLESVDIPYPASPTHALATVLVMRTKLWHRGLEPRQPQSISAEELSRIDACWSAGLGLA